MDMHVRINEAGENVFAGGVDDLGSGGRDNPAINPRDGFVLAENIRHVAAVRRDNLSIFDQKTHWKILLPRITRMGTDESLDNAPPAKIGVLEVQEQSETETGNGQVTHHLGEMSRGKIFDHLGIDHDQFIDDQIGYQSIDDVTLINNIETSLLFNAMIPISKFNDQGIFIGLLVKPWFQCIQYLHGGANGGFAQLCMDDLIRAHP
jgi:hypothetical protein